jgi:hypothetical protein
MNQQLIHDWLDLPADNGPVTYYTLLGLSPDEGDVARIEQRVHERLEKVRCYQLSHPDEATEAMNRLAQALIVLTNPQSKQAYDAGLRTLAPAAPAAVARAEKPPAPAPSTMRLAVRTGRSPARNGAPDSGAKTVVDVDTTTIPPAPPPARSAVAATPEPVAPAVNGKPPAPSKEEPVALDEDDPDTPILESAPADPVFETARSSPAARRGLGTKRALYHRIAHTRQLLWAWDQAGKFLNRPKRRLTRPAEENELVRRLTEIRDLLEDFPALLGRPGQPGQHVSAIARQQFVLQTFKLLDLNQREALAKDWMAGRTLLAFHRQFLRQELRSLRKRTWWGRSIRAVRAALNDHPGYVLLAIGVATLGLALFHWVTR